MLVKKMEGRVKRVEKLAGNNWLITIELGMEVEFLAGQFVSLKVNDDGLRRSYSVASLPRGREIDLVVDISPMGVGSKYILGLKSGDVVEILGFLGKFVVSKESIDAQKELLMVGTGTGIVPFKPMIEDLLENKKYEGQINLVWGMRYETDLFWRIEFEEMQKKYQNFHFYLVLSKPDENWRGLKGHVGEVLGKIKMEKNMTVAFLCGNPEMVKEVKGQLVGVGVSEDSILQERFA